jgi:hypothetical protein
MVNGIVNVPVRVFPLNWAANDPLWPMASPEMPTVVPVKVAVNLLFAFVWPEPVYLAGLARPCPLDVTVLVVGLSVLFMNVP